jgi:hypothetical protein
MQQATVPGPPLAPSARPDVHRSGWEVPAWNDPRLPFALTLLTYAILGTTILGFNRNPFQILLTTSAGALLDMALAWFLRGRKIVPLSAFISCMSLSLLLNYSHNYWLLFWPVLLTVGSKYVLTFKGKHVFNPSMFGVAVSLLVSSELITTAPAYQWGGSWAMSAFIVMAALSLFVFRVKRTALILSFLFFYTLQVALRAYVMRFHLPAETLFLGTLTSAPFFIFTFYMLTDPQTSPKTPRGQIAFAFVLTLVDLYLHTKESVYTFFYAALIMATGKFLFLHARAFVQEGVWPHLKNGLLSRQALTSMGVVGAMGGGMVGFYHGVLHPNIVMDHLAFKLEKLPPERTGIHSTMDDVFHQVDPRIQHIAKWVLSVGDSVGVGDLFGDGKMALVFTNPLKKPSDRLAIYRNLGNYHFQRVHFKAIDALAQADPAVVGLPSSVAFVDYNNDGALDLLVTYGYGPSHLFKNTLKETGKLDFVDISDQVGLSGLSCIGTTATFFDYDLDGKLDFIIGNAVNPYLPDYKKPTPLNVFKLPQPEYPGDRRMFRFMHDSWHNATNGGQKYLFHNDGNGKFHRVDNQAMGIPETHWTISIAAADLNHDGWPDLYCASDFGPDDVYLNKQGKGFERVAGKMFGDIGRDTYKGMNTTIADFTRKGYEDVYVSDVHHSLQAEGSLLWMVRPTADPFHPSFTDEATKRGALNENRFGWGAAAGDLDNSGWLDIVQANGMVDDRLDHMYTEHKDYWYVNHKLMQSGPEIHTYADMWGDIRGREIYPDEKRRVYMNRGDHDMNQFVDVADQVGLTEGDNSRGIALVDLDNRGVLDVVITNQHGEASIYRNTLNDGAGPKRGWLGLSLVGTGPRTNRQAIGSQVTIRYPDRGKPVTQFQELKAVNGFSSQPDPRLHFGLGDYHGPVDVTVKWIGGQSVTYRGLQPDRYHVISQ